MPNEKKWELKTRITLNKFIRLLPWDLLYRVLSLKNTFRYTPFPSSLLHSRTPLYRNVPYLVLSFNDLLFLDSDFCLESSNGSGQEFTPLTNLNSCFFHSITSLLRTQTNKFTNLVYNMYIPPVLPNQHDGENKQKFCPYRILSFLGFEF